jgi:NADPH:quinone reductase-like Zn-dependent oxidoreductase
MRIGLPLMLAAMLASASGRGATPEPTMQAAVARGGTVRVQTVARPAAGAGQVLVEMRFAGVNPGDWKLASGHADGDAGESGDAAASADLTVANAADIPGLDGSGVIAALGAGVSGYRIGDPVILWSRTRGTYAQYVAVSSQALTRKPPGLTFEQAAGMAHAGLAAWNLLVDVAHVRAGQTVLILGGAGGVGSAAVQIAKINGAHIITTASARNADYLKSIGADQVIDYSRVHFEEQVRNLDIVLNTVDADDAYRGLAVLKQGGFLLSVNGLPAGELCAKRAVTCSYRTAGTTTAVALHQLADWAQAGRYRINIDRVFNLPGVLQAWRYSQAGHTRGKSVIRIDQ